VADAAVLDAPVADAAVLDAPVADAAVLDAPVADAAPLGCPQSEVPTGTRYAAALVAERELDPGGAARTRYAVGDWDADGWPDVFAFQSDGTDHQIRVYGGASCFTEVASASVPFTLRFHGYVVGARAADHDGDGRADLHVVQIHQERPDMMRLSIFSATGAPPFAEVLHDHDVRAMWELGPRVVLAGDDPPDLLAVCNEPGISKLYVERFTAAGGYAHLDGMHPLPLASSFGGGPSRAYAAAGESFVAVHDVGGTTEVVGLSADLATIAFTQPLPSSVPSPSSQDFALADWDDDGVLDLFVFRSFDVTPRTMEILSGD
jgi:hypothetical protein